CATCTLPHVTLHSPLYAFLAAASLLLLLSTIRPPPLPNLFPYTTLFRSRPAAGLRAQPRAAAAGRRNRSAHRQSPASAAASTATDRKSTRLNSSHVSSSYAVFCLKKKKTVTSRSESRQLTRHKRQNGPDS